MKHLTYRCKTQKEIFELERFYHQMNSTYNANNGYSNDDFYNGFENYTDDYNYYGTNNNSGSTNGNVGNNGENTNSCITNTATAQGYLDPTNTSDPSPVSGEDTVTLGCIMADIEKTADRDSVSAGDRIRYTITFRNMSGREMYNVKITDQLPPYLDVIATSIVPFPQAGESLADGITIGRVPAGAYRTLTFAATVTDDVSEDIVNRAFADFNFRDSDGREQSASTPITSVTTTVENAGITVTKTANKSYVTAKGEEVEFTVTVTNNSSRGISDLVVTDNLPANLVYLENSTSINGANPINADPTGGIYIGRLKSGESVTVKFGVTVNI